MSLTISKTLLKMILDLNYINLINVCKQKKISRWDYKNEKIKSDCLLTYELINFYSIEDNKNKNTKKETAEDYLIYFRSKYLPICIIDIILTHINMLNMYSLRDHYFNKSPHLDSFECTWQWIIKKKRNLPELFIIEFFPYLNMDDLILFQKIPDKIFNNNINILNWEYISESYKYITSDFIKKYEKNLLWENVSKNSFVDIEVLFKYENKVDWEAVFVYHCNIPNKYISKVRDYKNKQYLGKKGFYVYCKNSKTIVVHRHKNNK